MKMNKNNKIYLRLRGNMAIPFLEFGTKIENFVNRGDSADAWAQ